MKTLLITGASGFLGWNLCRRLNTTWRIWGTYYLHPLTIKGADLVKIDLTVYIDLKKLFVELKPTAVIHTAAASNPDFCQKNRSVSYKINTEAAVNIAGLCCDLQIPCLFTSTDLVFDGLNPPYREEDATSPLSTYGEHKVQAELGMQKRHSGVVICRMPLMFGDPGPYASSFIQPLIRQMKAGHKINLFTDEYRTPLSATDAADGLTMALEHRPDIIHLGGSESISRFEFAKLLAKIFDYPDARLNPCEQKDVELSVPRPPDVSLDSTKAQLWGFQPDNLEQSLQDLRHTIQLN